MKKNTILNIATILLFTIIFLFFGNIVYATSITEIFEGADDFLKQGEQGDKENGLLNFTNVNSTSDLIFNIFFIVGICTTILVGTIMGIKFIMGSVEQKVKIKESLIPYIAGTVIIFSAFGIWKLIIELLK